MRFQAVLFDLDGTLVDSAPDLAGAANDLLARHGRATLPFVTLRPRAGSGARGMVGAAFGLAPGDAGYDELRDEFLAIYATRLLRHSKVFDEVDDMLRRIESRGVRWGVVTNKVVGLAEPLLTGLALRSRAAVVVGGDTTRHLKPHPAPLWHAAAELGVAPGTCVYVGDDRRDILAGRAAGMATVAAAWGYLGEGQDVRDWAADHAAASPIEVLNWLELA